MRYETSWKSRTVGTPATAGSGTEATGLWPVRDRQHAENHATKRLPMGTNASARRGQGPDGQAGARPAPKVECPSEAGLGELPAEGRVGVWFWHRFVDLPSYCPVDRATLWCPLPRRSHPAFDGIVGFFPPRSLNAEPSNAMKQLLRGGSTTTGQGSSVGPHERVPTWYLSMRRAFCCTHWLGEHGRLAARRRCCGSGPGIAGVFLQSADCLSRPAVTIWDGICSFTWTARFDRSRSLPLCAIFCIICRARSLSSGIIWELTRVMLCVSGWLDAAEFMWNTFRGMLLSLIPTSTGGLTSRATRWRTIAPRTLNNCMRGFWPPLKVQRINSLCCARLFMQLDCLLGSGIEYYFYRYQ